MEILVLIGVIAAVVYFAARGRQARPKSNELVIRVSTNHGADRPHSKDTTTDRWGRDDDFVPEPVKTIGNASIFMGLAYCLQRAATELPIQIKKA